MIYSSLHNTMSNNQFDFCSLLYERVNLFCTFVIVCTFWHMSVCILKF